MVSADHKIGVRNPLGVSPKRGVERSWVVQNRQEGHEDRRGGGDLVTFKEVRRKRDDLIGYPWPGMTILGKVQPDVPEPQRREWKKQQEKRQLLHSLSDKKWGQTDGA